MNAMEKYLEAMEVAVEVRDIKAIELLDAFSSYVYQTIYARANESTGKERETWEAMHQRARQLIARMASAKPSIWL